MIANYLKSNKHIPALAAALAMTLCIGVVIFAVGVNALLNPNTQPVLASSGDSSSAAIADTAGLQQMQDLLAQYQAREQQYRTELQQAATQLNQANQQLQQYQSLVTGLENAGVIQINPDGRVFISGGRFRNDDGD